MTSATFVSDLPVEQTATGLAELSRRVNVARGEFLATQRRANVLAEKVSNAKGRLALSEEVQRHLEALQQRAHERSVGAFERVLSAILDDVLPGEGKVKLDLAYKNSSTWLDILVDKDGHAQDALEDNGGALANVLSTGLRYAALSRTKRRRVMVLDEADCWIAPERIPAYANVVAKVSQGTGTQTLLVSHHVNEYFENLLHTIELGLDENGDVEVRGVSHVGPDWSSDEEPGIRAIHLENFGRHKDTFLRFRPGATAIVGQNNLGKSTALRSALMACAYGVSRDAQIRRGADEAKITIYLEQGRRIEWSRKLRRNPVVLFKLFHGEKLVNEGRPPARSNVPEWVTSELGIEPIDELDVQLWSQKRPVFLLDDTASRRAKVLSVGREASHLQGLMAEYDLQKTADNQTVRTGEQELQALGPLLRAKDLFEDLPAASEEAIAAHRVAMDLRSTLSQLDADLQRLSRALQRPALVDSCLAGLPFAPQRPHATWPDELLVLLDESHAALQRSLTGVPEPVLQPRAENPKSLLDEVRSLSLSESVCRLTVPPGVTIPSATRPLELISHGVQLKRCLDFINSIGKMPEAMSIPAVAPVADLNEQLAAIERSFTIIAEHEKASVALASDLEQLARDEQDAKSALGNRCLQCNAVLPEVGFKHVH